MGRSIQKFMTFNVERFETINNEELVKLLKDLKVIEKEASDYFETIKDFIAQVSASGHKSTPDEIKKKAEINYKDTLWQVERQVIIDAMKPIVVAHFDGNLDEYEEVASVELDNEDDSKIVVKITNALEEFKKAYAEKNQIASPYAEETVA